MQVIDLDTGKLVEVEDTPKFLAETNAQNVNAPPQVVSGGIIDLDTGEIIRRDIGGAQSQHRPGEPDIRPFPEQREETRAVKGEGDLPPLRELGSGTLLKGESLAKIAALTPILMATTNNSELADILVNSFDSLGKSFDPGGNELLTNNKTGARVIVNTPGLSKLDLLQGLGITAAFLPGGAATTATGALVKATGAGAKKVLGATVGAGAVTSGLTQTGIESAQAATGGEFDTSEVALAAGLGGAAELVAPGIQALRQGRQAKRLDVARGELQETIGRIAPAREAQEALESVTGVNVPLFPAQQTQQPSTLLKQRLLPQLDAGAKKAAKELESQNKQVFEATIELINKIAPPDVVVAGSKQFREASQKALKSVRQQRSAAVKPLYDEAFDLARAEGKNVDLKPVNDFINKELKNLISDDPAAIALNSFMKRLKGEKVAGRPSGAILSESGAPLIPATSGGNKPLSLEQLQSAKFTTDAQIDKSGGLILNSAQKNAKRLLSQAEKLYVEQLGELSPAFKAANREFARLSPGVKEVEDSLLGVAAKVKDVDLQNISNRIFAKNSNATVVKKAKELIDKVDPTAWNNMLRTEFQKRIGGFEELVEDIPGELAGNLPGKLRRSIFGREENRRTLLAAMNPEQRKNFVYLDEVLKRASSGREAGSTTAPFGAVLDRLKGSAAAIRDMIFRPLQSLQEFGERGLFDRNVSKLTDVLFDPKWEPKLRELRSVNPRSERSRVILEELINSAKVSPQAAKSSAGDGSKDKEDE